MNRKNKVQIAVLALALAAVAVIALLIPGAGISIGKLFAGNLKTMVKILPLTFILISLFEVWVKKETVERHLGEEGGFKSYFWALLLGGTTIGPMVVALPVAAALSRKGARLSVIFTYIGAAGVCRVPMTIFESSYMGVKFTLIRYSVSIPLIILSSILLSRALRGGAYEIKEA